MTARKPNPRRETDLFEPVRDFLIANGYAVRSEVKHCDVAARKGDDLIVVELKLQFGVDLLIQALERQRLTDSVYVAIPRPADMGRRSRWPGIKRLLRQLELGLILVTLDGAAPRVEVAFHPLPFQRRKQKRARRAVIEEMINRSADHNRGGSARRKLVTAYRETAIQIACALEALGPQSPRQLRALGTGPKTTSILYDNHYGWFDHTGPGRYSLTPQGKTDLCGFADLAESYRGKLREAASEENEE